MLKKAEIVWLMVSAWVIDGFYEVIAFLVHAAFYLVAIAAVACGVGWVVFIAAIPWLLLKYFAG